MFQLVPDGGCDFTKEEAQQHNIDIVPFYVSFDEKTYLKEGIDIAKDEYLVHSSPRLGLSHNLA